MTIRPSPEPPDRPTGLIASEIHQAATLSWNDPRDASVTGYQILRRNKATTPVGGQYDVIQDDTSSAATTYVDTDVMPEGKYAYRVFGFLRVHFSQGVHSVVTLFSTVSTCSRSHRSPATCDTFVGSKSLEATKMNVIWIVAKFMRETKVPDRLLRPRLELRS